MSHDEVFAKILRNWSLITPPQRPNAEVVAAMGHELRGKDGPGLLLGATPEFAGLVDDLLAIDISPTMLSALWLRGAPLRRAVVGDWRRMPFAARSFSVCISDGSPTLMRCSEELELFFAEVAKVMRPEAVAVFRVFVSPDRSETPAMLKRAALDRTIESFQSYKWRLGMVLSAADGRFNTSFRAIYDAFNEMFPDRDALIRTTGWSRPQIDAIEQYKGIKAVLSFPTRDVLAGLASRSFRKVGFVDAGTYELADCCPLLIMKPI
jgi:SAM-dependent methyltransferase